MRKDETPVKKREFSLLLRGGLTIGTAVAVVLLWPGTTASAPWRWVP